MPRPSSARRASSRASASRRSDGLPPPDSSWSSARRASAMALSTGPGRRSIRASIARRSAWSSDGQGRGVGPLTLGDPLPGESAEQEGGDGRGRGGGGQGRPVLPGPAAGPAGEGLGVGGDRLVGEPAVEVVGQGSGRGVAVLGLQGHRLEADRFQGRVEPGGEGSRGRGNSPAWTLRRSSPRVLAGERGAAGQEVVEGGAQAVDVAGRAEQVEPAGGLLGAHVGGRADDRAGLGLGRAARPRRAGARPRAGGRRVVDGPGSPDRPRALARPQSTTRVSPYWPTITLSGLRSRCRTPRLWA